MGCRLYLRGCAARREASRRWLRPRDSCRRDHRRCEGKVDKQQKGVGPKIEILDLKVINEEGWGYTSTLIHAVEWRLEHQNKYKIEVANFSLGHPPTESYKTDPLCAAVRKLVAAGIVTVVSGGNLGKTNEYPKIWGGITSPGIEPSVITVSPINTQGTITHTDDTATSYGSRGPTIDGQFKPDLAAPGNAIASTLSENSWLEQNLPGQLVGNTYIELRGSSMATAFVTGTVASMLHANHKLTPHMVKVLLLLTAAKTGPALDARAGQRNAERQSGS